MSSVISRDAQNDVTFTFCREVCTCCMWHHFFRIKLKVIIGISLSTHIMLANQGNPYIHSTTVLCDTALHMLWWHIIRTMHVCTFIASECKMIENSNRTVMIACVYLHIYVCASLRPGTMERHAKMALSIRRKVGLIRFHLVLSTVLFMNSSHCFLKTFFLLLKKSKQGSV